MTLHYDVISQVQRRLPKYREQIWKRLEDLREQYCRGYSKYKNYAESGQLFVTMVEKMRQVIYQDPHYQATGIYLNESFISCEVNQINTSIQGKHWVDDMHWQTKHWNAMQSVFALAAHMPHVVVILLAG